MHCHCACRKKEPPDYALPHRYSLSVGCAVISSLFWCTSYLATGLNWAIHFWCALTFHCRAKFVLATTSGLISELRLRNSLGAHQRQCGLSQLDQKQSSRAPTDPIWACATDDKEEVTGCHSTGRLTHGSALLGLIHRPDRITAVDY